MHSIAGPVVLLGSVFFNQVAYAPSWLSDWQTQALEEGSSATRGPAQKFPSGQIAPVEAPSSDSNSMIHPSGLRWSHKALTVEKQARQHLAKRTFLDLNASPEHELGLDLPSDETELYNVLHAQDSLSSTLKERTSKASLSELKSLPTSASTGDSIRPVLQIQPYDAHRKGPDLNLTPSQNDHINGFLEPTELSYSQTPESSGSSLTGPNKDFFFSTSPDNNRPPSPTIPAPARAWEDVECAASSKKEGRNSSRKELSAVTNQETEPRSQFSNSKKRPCPPTSPDGAIQPAQAGGEYVDPEKPFKLKKLLFDTKGRASAQIMSSSLSVTNDFHPVLPRDGPAPPLLVPITHASTPTDLMTGASDSNHHVNILKSTPHTATQVPDNKEKAPAVENSCQSDSELNPSMKQIGPRETGMSSEHSDSKETPETGSADFPNHVFEDTTIDNSIEGRKINLFSELQVEEWFKTQMQIYHHATTKTRPRVLQKIVKVVFKLTPVEPRIFHTMKATDTDDSQSLLWTPVEIFKDYMQNYNKFGVDRYCYLYLKRFLTNYYQNGYRKLLKENVKLSPNACKELDHELLIMEGITIFESIEGHERLTKVLLKAQNKILAELEKNKIEHSNLLKVNQDSKLDWAPVPLEENTAESSRILSISELRAPRLNGHRIPQNFLFSVDSTILYFCYIEHMHQMLKGRTNNYGENLKDLQQKGIDFLENFWQEFFRYPHQPSFSYYNLPMHMVVSAMNSMEDKLVKSAGRNISNSWVVKLLMLSLSQCERLQDFSAIIFEDIGAGNRAFVKFLVNQVISKLLIQDLS